LVKRKLDSVINYDTQCVRRPRRDRSEGKGQHVEPHMCAILFSVIMERSSFRELLVIAGLCQSFYRVIWHRVHT
jgi:hypothetical protein